MKYLSKKEKGIVISLIGTDGKYSNSKASKNFKKISSYQLKRLTDEKVDPNTLLEENIELIKKQYPKGSLVIDDTVIEKPYAEKMECVYWMFSSKEKRKLKGINLTVLIWKCGKKLIPLKFMVHEKDEQGKSIQKRNDFAVESLKYAYERGLSPEKVLFDSNFASNNVLNFVDSVGWKYFSQLPCSRLFRGNQLKNQRFQPQPYKGKLRGVGHEVSVSKHCKRFYVTNMTECNVSRQKMVSEYRQRWCIEVFFRDLKQSCHLEEYQGLKTLSQRRFIYYCFKAYSVLQDLNQKSIFQAKMHFWCNHLGLKLSFDKALNGF